jgi:hypothetical protein
MISKFIGGLASKALEFYGSFTIIVGMLEIIDIPH